MRALVGLDGVLTPGGGRSILSPSYEPFTGCSETSRLCRHTRNKGLNRAHIPRGLELFSSVQAYWPNIQKFIS